MEKSEVNRNGSAAAGAEGMKSHRQSPLSKNDIVQTNGIDLFGFIKQNATIKTLAMDAVKRKNFFDDRPELLSLLRQEKMNPLLEEGHLQDAEHRDKMGEYFINFDALQIYVDEKIRKRNVSEGGIPYNTNNIFLACNDEKKLKNLIGSLHLKENEDAKFIYVNQVHAVPFYIRNIRGRIYCFVVDSEPYPRNIPVWLRDVLRANYPDAVLLRNTQFLQRDFYSCTTFAIKALKYFVKHGDEVFPYLFAAAKQGGVSYDAINKCHHLSEDLLMPILSKMWQGHVSVSGENNIVCKKGNVTLSEYWKKHEVIFGGLPYSTVALEKKYQYLDDISKALTK